MSNDYYVSINGNDQNDDRSEERPMQLFDKTASIRFTEELKGVYEG